MAGTQRGMNGVGSAGGGGVSGPGRPSDEPRGHLCCLYRDEAHRRRVTATFVEGALGSGERVMYVSGTHRPAAVLSALHEDGVEVDPALRSGQLVVRPLDDLPSARPLRIDELEQQVREAVALARADGFPGLRLATEMTRVLDALGSFEQLLAWERLAGELRREVAVTAVCQYEEGLLEEAEAVLVEAEHTGAAPELGVVPLARLLAVDRPFGLRVSGELDLSNREELVRALEARAAVNPEMQLDLKGLSFIDVGSLRAIYEVASRLPEGGRITLVDLTDPVRKVMDLAGLCHERVEIVS